ncbi:MULTISPECIES: hypothetical protein [Anaerotruncus]|jgi:hypothetical protein|uniref:Uncharacterized protein n=1 Tax=Anaerotruncus colihominis TaxID=169435 RepID=A0A845RCV5_9FIRM|nr:MULTISPECIES: hypothetical protein [Anaerotruncus]MCI8492488.1 hypothetical protein [Anaerotruncus sp.]MCR2025016.1 hypothetical protein [Anaerotruncus colihominis]NBI77996.1 hypothetical protein [Anaerotruncus colihominis]NDO40138.1 hypothetical protein [Anaerotruncus colihominis]
MKIDISPRYVKTAARQGHSKKMAENKSQPGQAGRTRPFVEKEEQGSGWAYFLQKAKRSLSKASFAQTWCR